jgi:hypothetical protein
METRLHSYETYLYKYFLPIAWFPWRGFGSLQRAFPPGDPNSANMRWVSIILWCLIYSLAVSYAVRLKTVFVSETGLRVRGYITEIELPFSDLASVKHNWFFRNDTLFLTVRSKFGNGILFIARRRVMTESGAVSTLDMLRGLITQGTDAEQVVGGKAR